MEDPNDAFRGPPGSAHHAALNELPLAPGQTPHRVPVPSSTSKHHGNVHARRQPNLNPSTGGVKTEADANLWSAASNSANVNHSYPQPINFQGTQRWAPDPSLSNEYMQGYGFSDNLADGLPNIPYGQPVGSAFELGQAAGGVPNLDSSSSSSCRVNGSSPNTVFGSFSSSIGPTDLMDMGAAEECFHSPSAFPSEVPQPGAIPQALLSRSAAHNFGITPGMVLAEAETVSPKMLNLKNVPSLPSSSSSESLPNPFHMDSDSEVASALAQAPEAILSSSSAWHQKREPGPKPGATGRKQLPDKAPHSKAAAASSSGPKRRHGGEVPGDKSSAPSSKKSKAKTKAPSQPKSQAQPSSHNNKHHHHHHHRSTGGSEPRAKSSHSKASSSSSKEQEPPAVPARSDKDEFLVQSKLSGMTYKEIRKMGGFTEAESTLRGRFRTLTKPKEARVRKPEFQEIDVSVFFFVSTLPGGDAVAFI